MAAAKKVEVNLTGDTKNFVVAFEEAGKVADKVQKKIKGSTKAANDMQTTFRGAANATAILNGPLNGISGRLSSLSAAFGTLNPGVIAAGVGFSTLTAVVVKSLSAFTDYESQMLRLEAVVKATGGAAGLTAADMDEMSKAIGKNTLANADQVRDAAGALATFRNIGYDAFSTTLVLAQDLSEVMGQDLKTSVLQLGKALDDPITGITALRRAGVSFSESQKETIRNMVEMGDVAGAQTLILAELAKQVGGAGTAAAGGLKGKVDSLNESWTIFKETLGSSTVIQGTAAGALDVLTGAVERLEGAIAPTSAQEYFEEIKRLQNQLSAGIADDPEADSEQSSGVVEARLAIVRKRYEEELKLEEDAVSASLEARRTGAEVQKAQQEKQLADAAEGRRKDTADAIQSANNKALIAEQLALKVSGNLEAAEGIRYAREANAAAAQLKKHEDDGLATEEVKEAYRRREEALYTQHLANMDAIAEGRADDVKLIEKRLNNEQAINEKAFVKDLAEKDAAAKKELKFKGKINDQHADMVGESLALLASASEEGSRIQKAALVADKATALAKAAMHMHSAIANANDMGPYEKWFHIAAATTQGLAAIAGITAVGVAHGGADYIPEESTYLLNRGERVLSPNQNRDLIKFMKSGGGAMTVNIVEDASRSGTVERDESELTVFVAAAMAQLESDISRGRGVAPAISRMTGTTRRGR